MTRDEFIKEVKEGRNFPQIGTNPVPLSTLRGAKDWKSLELQASSYHRAQTVIAVAKGKSVDNDVLKDYPDLAKRGKVSPAPAPSQPEKAPAKPQPAARPEPPAKPIPVHQRLAKIDNDLNRLGVKSTVIRAVRDLLSRVASVNRKRFDELKVIIRPSTESKDIGEYTDAPAFYEPTTNEFVIHSDKLEGVDVELVFLEESFHFIEFALEDDERAKLVQAWLDFFKNENTAAKAFQNNYLALWGDKAEAQRARMTDAHWASEWFAQQGIKAFHEQRAFDDRIREDKTLWAAIKRSVYKLLAPLLKDAKLRFGDVKVEARIREILNVFIGPEAKAGKAEAVEKKAELKPAVQPKAKEPWQMTRADLIRAQFSDPALADAFVKRLDEFDSIPEGKQKPFWSDKYPDYAYAARMTGVTADGIIQATIRIPRHRAQVEKALSEGKPVPPEVLAEYPDLAKKVEPKAKPPAAPAPSVLEAINAGQPVRLPKGANAVQVKTAKGRARVLAEDIGTLEGGGPYIDAVPLLARKDRTGKWRLGEASKIEGEIAVKETAPKEPPLITPEEQAGLIRQGPPSETVVRIQAEEAAFKDQKKVKQLEERMDNLRYARDAQAQDSTRWKALDAQYRAAQKQWKTAAAQAKPAPSPAVKAEVAAPAPKPSETAAKFSAPSPIAGETIPPLEPGKPGDTFSMGGQTVRFSAPGPVTIKAYHGTPHKVDKFSTEKVGTGEGAQAYGWGIYVSDRLEVADSYRTALARGTMPSSAYKSLPDGVTRNAKLLAQLAVAHPSAIKDFRSGNVEGRNMMVSVMRGLLQDREIGKAVVRLVPVDVMDMLLGKKFPTKELLHNPAMLIDLLPVDGNDSVASRVKAMNELSPYVALATAKRPLLGTHLAGELGERFATTFTDKIDFHTSKIPYPKEDVNTGNVYQVRVKSEQEYFLDWDKPLSEQSEKVRKAMDLSTKEGRKQWLAKRAQQRGDTLEMAVETLGTVWGFKNDDTGSILYGKIGGQNSQESSEHLASLGIKGIRYRDQGSRVSPLEIEAARKGVESWRGKDADQLRYAEQHLSNLERKQREGTSNYVIFSADDIEITHENGEPVNVQDLVDEKQQRQSALFSAPGRPTVSAQDKAYLDLAAKYEAGDKSVDPQLQKMVEEAARGAGYNVGPVWHGGSFDIKEGDAVFSEWTHFGTKAAAEERVGGSGVVDDLIKSVETYHDEESDKWFFSVQNVEDETPFDSEDEAQKAGEKEAVQMADYAEPPESVFTRTFLGGNFAKVPDLGTWGLFEVMRRLPEQYKLTESERDEVGRLATYGKEGEDWKKLTDILIGKGLSGLEYINKIEDKGSTSYVVFDPSQIKSADPITRDDQGNIIPPSQRFNPEKQDIRFSAPAVKHPPPVKPTPPRPKPQPGQIPGRKVSTALHAIRNSEGFARAWPEAARHIDAGIEYMPETKEARAEFAKRYLSQFGEDLEAAFISVKNPENFSGINTWSIQVHILGQIWERLNALRAKQGSSFVKHDMLRALIDYFQQGSSRPGQDLQAIQDIIADIDPDFHVRQAQKLFAKQQEKIGKAVGDALVGILAGVQEAGAEAADKMQAVIDSLERKVDELRALIRLPDPSGFPVVADYVRAMGETAARMVRRKASGKLAAESLPGLMKRVQAEVVRQLEAAFAKVQTPPAKMTPAQKMRMELETVDVAERAYNTAIEEIRAVKPDAVPEKVARFDRTAAFRHARPAVIQALQGMGYKTAKALRALFESDATDWTAIHDEIVRRVARASGTPDNETIRNATSAAADDYLDAAYSEFRKALAPPVREAYEKAAGRRLVSGLTARLKTGVPKTALEAFYSRLVAAVAQQYGERLPKAQKSKLDPLETVQRAMAELVANRDKYEAVIKEALDQAGKDEKMDAKTLAALEAAFGAELETMTAKQASRALVLGARAAGLALRDVMSSSLAGQAASRKAIIERALAHPVLQALADEDAQQVAEALGKAWEAKRNEIFRQEFARLVPLPNIPKANAAKVRAALPRLLKLANLELLDNEAFYNAVAPEFGLPEFTQEIADTIYRLAQGVQAKPDGYIKQRALRQMYDYIQAKSGLSWVEFMGSFWYASVLSGLGTQGTNIQGSAFNVATSALLTAGANPKIAPGILYRFWQGIITGWGSKWHDIVGQGDMTARINEEVKQASSGVELGANDPRRLMRALAPIRYVLRVMSFFDAVFAGGAQEQRAYLLAYNRARGQGISEADVLAEMDDMLKLRPVDLTAAKAQAAQELSEGLIGAADVRRRIQEILEQARPIELMDGAKTFALKDTFNSRLQDSGTVLGLMGNLLATMKRKLPGMTPIVPFVSVPMNAMNVLLDFSPIAWYRLGQQAGTLKPLSKDLFQQLSPEDIQLLRMRALLGMTTYPAVIALIMLQPDDPEKRWFDIWGGLKLLTPDQKRQLLSEKTKPYHIRVGKAVFNYQYTPLAIPLAVVGNFWDRYRYSGINKESIANMLAGDILDSLLMGKDWSALAEFSRFIGLLMKEKGGVDAAADYLKAFPARTVGGFVPNILKELDTYRDPQAYRNLSILDYYQQHVPVVRGLGQQPSLNILGEPVKIVKWPWSRFFDQITDDPVWRELSKKADKGVFIPAVVRRAKHDKEGRRVPMTDGENYEFQSRVGHRYRAAIQTSINKGEFQAMTAEETEKFFKRFRHIRSRVASEMGFGRGED